jgi:hypothetical protein
VIDKWKIPYTKLHEYSLQLSFYAGILRRKGIEVDSNGWLIHFSDINPNYVLHKCVDYSEVVEWVFAELEQKFAWRGNFQRAKERFMDAYGDSGMGITTP